MLTVFSDDFFMQQAMDEAILSADENEIPVGAIIVSNNKIIARCHNQTEALKDVTAHAEMLAITAASAFLGSKYLDQCTLYVTLEPCPMCATALRYSRIKRIVYAAQDEKYGYMKYGNEMLHPKTNVEYGLQEKSSIHLLKSFFETRRK